MLRVSNMNRRLLCAFLDTFAEKLSAFQARNRPEHRSNGSRMVAETSYESFIINELAEATVEPTGK